MRSFQDHDYLLLCDWLAKRGEQPPAKDWLPPTGIIVDNVACGFLIKCDNGFGILDFFISNPDMPAFARGSALDEIAEALIDSAKRAGIKALKCDTGVVSIYKLAVRHGFKPVGYYKAMARGI